MIIAFLGKNTAGILADYKKIVGNTDEKVVVIKRTEDQLQWPDAVTYEEAKSVINLTLWEGKRVTLICNGGTTAQQVPLVKWLAHADFHRVMVMDQDSLISFIEVTREGITEL